MKALNIKYDIITTILKHPADVINQYIKIQTRNDLIEYAKQGPVYVQRVATVHGPITREDE